MTTAPGTPQITWADMRGILECLRSPSDISLGRRLLKQLELHACLANETKEAKTYSLNNVRICEKYLADCALDVSNPDILLFIMPSQQ